MKATKKIAGILLAILLVFAMTTTAFAQEKNVGGGSGSITINNAAKSETYTIYKLFDATVDGNKSIAYTGDIPAELNAYFTKDSAGNISETAAARNGEAMSDGLKAALTTWAGTAAATSSEVSDGTALTFSNIPYGYYVMTSTQGNNNIISVDSTFPNAVIYDKNSTSPSEINKAANETNVNIGDTVTYTVSFKTSNYDGTGATALGIKSYTIEDTLPDFLSNVNVTSIIVDDDANDTTTNDQTNVTAQFSNKKIVLEWYDEATSQFKYNNGAKVTITYTAVVTDKAAIDGTGNTNTVTVSWTRSDDTPSTDKLTDTETIYTYALAIKKVNNEGTALAGAKFELPFYVKEAADTDGAYIYAGAATGSGLTNQLTTPATGVIVVKGVKTGTYSITEVTAPNGYNKLTAPVSVEVVKTSATTTNKTVYIDANGQITDTQTENTKTVTVQLDNIAATPVVVVNMKGTELPSTGGVGTTMMFIVGGALALGAAVLFVTKKRMSKNAD